MSSAPPRSVSLKKYFEGWELGVVALTIALGTAVVVVPRAVPPDAVPTPFVEPREANEVLIHDAALAKTVIDHPLDGHVRRLGSAVRSYGAQEAKRDVKALTEAKSRIEAAALLVPSSDDVLRLRAYQTEVFETALQAWEATGRVSTDLEELGGGFLDLLHDNEWVEIDGTRRVVLPRGIVLKALFKKRWNEVVGAGSDAFALSRVEARALAGFLLAHPSLPAGAAGSGVSASAFQDQMRLKKISELEKIDPEYPASYARGIVLYHLGAYQGAVQAFGRYLESTPSGPYALRATNFLRASLDHAEL